MRRLASIEPSTYFGFIRNLTCVLAILALITSLRAQNVDARTAPIAAALREQQFDKALHLLEPILKEFPANAQLWTMQGVAYEGLGREKEALVSFRRALKISPDNIPALQKAAQIEYDAGDPEGIPLIERILRLRPNDRTSHGMLAILEYQQGKCEEAALHFDQAAPLFDSQLPALHAFGTCLVKLKRFDKAEEVFEKSLSLNSGDPQERMIVASVHLMAHQPQRAIDILQLLLKTNQTAPLLELASAAYEDLHNTEEAVDALRQAILLDPHNVGLYVDFAALSATHQSFQVGIDAVNDGISLEPKAAPLYFARGVLYVQFADYDKAQADFEKAYELDPNQSLSVAAQGLAAVQRNGLAQALAGVQEKLARRPDDPILLYMQADILVQEGADPGSRDFQTALRSARRAVALRPALGPARGVLAKLYLQSGQYPEAAAECRKALEIDPKDQASLYHLIQALRKAGKMDEIPPLLKRLAALRQQATKDEREQYRYKLVEGEAGSK
jgi:tetratricopeptide (TPR) repeat protein